MTVLDFSVRVVKLLFTVKRRALKRTPFLEGKLLVLFFLLVTSDKVDKCNLCSRITRFVLFECRNFNTSTF